MIESESSADGRYRPSCPYDFAHEAAVVCDAIGSSNGCMTVECALREAYQVGAAILTERTRLLRTALLALRSYQYGNAATDLAEEVADAIDAHLRAAASEVK